MNQPPIKSVSFMPLEEQKKHPDCCGVCCHFSPFGMTLSEFSEKYKNTPYAEVNFGECPFKMKEGLPMPGYNLNDAEGYIWETRTPCEQFKRWEGPF